MNLRYISNITTKANSEKKYSYAITTEVIPNFVCDSSSYEYDSLDEAKQFGLAKCRELGYEVCRGYDLRNAYLNPNTNKIKDKFYDDIASGDFSNIYVGDYFRIPVKQFSVTETTPEPDVCTKCGQEITTDKQKEYSVISSSQKTMKIVVVDIDFDQKQITLMPQTPLGFYGIHNNQEPVSYKDSFFYTKIRPVIYENLHEIFGAHLDKSSLDLPSISQIFGEISGCSYTSISLNLQFGQFLINRKAIAVDINYWLRDMKEYGKFYYVTADGHLNYSSQDNFYGIRPLFIIS